MKQSATVKDPAFPVMAMDILGNVLSRADNPGELGTYLTEEIRDLTGARCVLLIQCLGTTTTTTTVTEHRVVSINPLRRRAWAESPAVKRLYDVVHNMPAAQFWCGDEPAELSELLRQEGFDLSMIFPLNAGAVRVGAMLVLGLPDEEHISSVLSLLNALSTIVTLVLRNSFLFENQERIIQERTAELRAGEEIFRAVADFTYDWETWIDPDGKFIYVSPSCQRITGYSADEFINDDELFARIVHPDDRAMVEKHLEEVLAGNIPEHRMDFRITTRKDEVGWIEHFCQSVFGADGSWLGQRASNRDITERKRAEERIRKLNTVQAVLHDPGTLYEKLKRITDGVVDIFAADFARIWLIGPGDLCDLGCQHAGVTEGPHVCRHRDQCLHLVSSSGRYTHLDGKMHGRVPFGCYKIGLIASGRIASFLTNDVAHDPRIHNHEWAASLGLAAFAGYQLRPPHGKTIGVLALFSQHPISSEEDALLKSLGNLIVPVIQTSQAEEEIRRLNESLEKRVEERTAALREKSDELRDSQTALMHIVADLNKKTAELEAANEKLKELDRLKSMFIASMSHELRTPLNSIIGFSSILADEWLGPVTEEQKKNLITVVRSGKHLLALINDMIDVSKIEGGKMETSVEAFDIFDVITEVTELFARESRDRGLEFVVEPFHQQVRTDRRRLSQCLINLLSNAVKFTVQGAIKTTSRIIPGGGIGGRPAGDLVEVAVEDTGIGIRAEDMEKLFGAFVRLTPPEHMLVKGTGLGLYLTRKIVRELLGGEIRVESIHGKGSRFTIRIPVEWRERRNNEESTGDRG